MPAISNEPETLRPYLFHGVNLRWKNGDEEAVGDCPWCTREGKFSVNILSGLWRCLVCNEGTETEEAIKGGNAITFIRMLWERSFDATSSESYTTLARERKLLEGTTLVHWQLAVSMMTNDWLCPGYNEHGKMTQLYRYVHIGKRRAWIPTPTLGHKLFGVANYDPSKPVVDLIEGLWDSTSWWEAIGKIKELEGKLVTTANTEASLLAQRNVLGIPGNLIFFGNWYPLFAGKIVNLLGQNDHPKKHPKTGAEIAPASYSGMQRIAKILSESPETPERINYLYWGENGYDLSKPSGYDIRDLLNA